MVPSIRDASENQLKTAAVSDWIIGRAELPECFASKSSECRRDEPTSSRLSGPGHHTRCCFQPTIGVYTDVPDFGFAISGTRNLSISENELPSRRYD